MWLRGCRYGHDGAGGGCDCRSSRGALISDQGLGAVERLLAIGGNSFPDGKLKLFTS